MYRFGIYYNRNCLSTTKVNLKRGHLDFISMKGAYIRTFVEAGMGNMTKSSIVKKLPLPDPVLAFFRG
jgi:hypothetical protein